MLIRLKKRKLWFPHWAQAFLYISRVIFPVALFTTPSILVLAFILFVLICKVTEVAEYFVHLQLYSINNKSQKMDFPLYPFAEVHKY